MTNRTLSIDPSGDGTTGYFFIDERGGYEFGEIKEQSFQIQMEYFNQLVRNYQPTTIIYEHTNYINYSGSSMTSLFKLFGAIENSKFVYDFVRELNSIPVNQVKGLRKLILAGKEQIEDLVYRIGKGWFYQEKKISVHQLDSFLVYYLWGKKK